MRYENGAVGRMWASAVNAGCMDGHRIRIYDSRVTTQEITRVMHDNGVEVISIGKQMETLEDYFLKLTADGE